MVGEMRRKELFRHVFFCVHKEKYIPYPVLMLLIGMLFVYMGRLMCYYL